MRSAMMQALMIQTTTATEADAETIAEELLAEGLAACVQIAAIRSRYVWKGEVQREAEQLLSIKTRADLWEPVRARIRALHSYEAPEVIALPVTDIDPDYLAWVEGVTRRP
ncbi:divalent-cation tolerance protein CutA [Phenylobacterium sp. J367]|uniref:divalent-cation tolerance protein CutA n=1 Tax=Phenylobacterium sp. J367 TaxID=2898435 RepID=UPI002150A332|nr:divalent-cation tolerance protein CutA [Phenylobacterium sp. J367]MCR5877118.1 divalent-cation tolerance protein CutA [Phenylobacterium sp. J367]